MSRNDTDSDPTRRTVLRSAVASGALLGGLGLATVSGRQKGERGFPPAGITEYGDSLDVGNGTVRPFTTETPSGKPKYHGVEIDRAALNGLPSADELAAADNTAEKDKYTASGQAKKIHRRWSLQYFVPFPEADGTPFTFLGLNWNPKGHPGGGGAWAAPHFDIHFHMLEPSTVDAITGPTTPPYGAIPDAKLPAGYLRGPKPSERYITDMGEHVAPANAPELPGNPEAFTNTLIQGFAAVDGEAQLSFVEPMLTRAYLRTVRGVEAFAVPQPAVYPHDNHHPTGYSVRAVPPTETIVVALQDFTGVS